MNHLPSPSSVYIVLFFCWTNLKLRIAKCPLLVCTFTAHREMDISKAPSPALEAVAGAAGALLALLSTYPLMTVNTRQQTEGKKADGTHDAVPANKKSTVGELLELIEEGGMGALYRGVQPAMIGNHWCNHG